MPIKDRSIVARILIEVGDRQNNTNVAYLALCDAEQHRQNARKTRLLKKYAGQGDLLDLLVEELIP